MGKASCQGKQNTPPGYVYPHSGLCRFRHLQSHNTTGGIMAFFKRVFRIVRPVFRPRVIGKRVGGVIWHGAYWRAAVWIIQVLLKPVTPEKLGDGLLVSLSFHDIVVTHIYGLWRLWGDLGGGDGNLMGSFAVAFSRRPEGFGYSGHGMLYLWREKSCACECYLTGETRKGVTINNLQIAVRQLWNPFAITSASFGNIASFAKKSL